MKRIGALLLVLVIMLATVGAASAAGVECTKWKDTGNYSKKTCKSDWCGINPWASRMHGTREQGRACSGYDDNGKYVAYSSTQWVKDVGNCC